MQHERFGGMRNDTANTPTEEELRIAERAYEEADPAQFSAINLEQEPSEIGRVPFKANCIVTDGTDTFFSLGDSSSPNAQKFTARVLKGIIPVSDIVSVTDSPNLYSKKLPHERIMGEAVSDADLLADTELLYQVFGDYDHLDERGSTHNALIENEQVSYHDFQMTNFTSQIIALRKTHTLESLEKLLSHLRALSKRLGGEEGLHFLEAVLRDTELAAKSFYKSNTASVEDLQSTLLRRIGNAEAFARMKRSELQQETAS